MDKGLRGLGALAAVVVLAGAPPAGAAARTASMGVSVTVVAACTIVPGPRSAGPACLRLAAPSAAPSPSPAVTYARDPKTGATIQTVVF